MRIKIQEKLTKYVQNTKNSNKMFCSFNFICYLCTNSLVSTK
nr:MAG TPA: hypothetical protein [Caudoviricetes sp.]